MVGSKNAYDHVKALYEGVQDDDRIIALDVTTVIEDVLQKHGVLHMTASQCNAWKGDVFLDKKAAALESIDAYQKAYQIMLDFMSSIQIVVDERKKSADGEKRKNRGARLKVVSAYTAAKAACPIKFAQLMSSWIHNLKGDERFSLFIGSNTSSSSGIQTGMFVGSFDKPCVFSSGEDDGACHWSIAVPAAVRTRQGEIDHLIQKASLIFDGDLKGKKFFLLVPLPLTEFAPNQVLCKNFDLHAVDVKPHLTIQRNFHFAKEIGANPCAGLSAFHAIVRGQAWVSVISVDALLRRGCGLHKIDQFIEEADAEWMKKNIWSFQLPAPCSLLRPVRLRRCHCWHGDGGPR